MGPYQFDDPCKDGNEPLIGATVLLFNRRGGYVTNSTTDENGVVEFTGLPGTRYSVEVIYHECTSQPSLAPSYTSLPSSKPTVTNWGGPEFDPCSAEDDVPLVGARVTLYDARGKYMENTTTGSDGYYTFTGEPPGARYSIVVDYPECGRRELSNSASIKFYKNDNFCDTMFSAGDWDVISTADFTYFDTLDECCANMFWYGMDGCFSRSHTAFQFEFCIEISGIDEHFNCPLNEIRAIESAMQNGLDVNSKLSLVEFGSTALTNVGGGTKCIGPTLHQDAIANQLRGVDGPHKTKLCGVVATHEAGCQEENCLRNTYESTLRLFQHYFDSDEFTSALHSLPIGRVRPLLDKHSVEVVPSSFMARKILLPLTVMSVKQIEEEAAPLEYSATTTDVPRFYPTYISGQLCQSKTPFDSWEEAYGTLKDCCQAHFSIEYEACCSSSKMGGCM